MKTNIKIAPSILSANFSEMGSEIKKIEKAGADLIHCDVMDGVFVNNLTFGIKMIADLRPLTKLALDTHLMIVNPEKYVARFAEAGSDIITVHYEACGEKSGEVLKSIRSLGAKAGLSINPDTPVSKIENLIDECDLVLLMSVFPGFGGQKYIEAVTDKIAEVKAIVKTRGLKTLIEVDGGINAQTAPVAINAGADILVAGNAVFKAENKAEAIANLKG